MLTLIKAHSPVWADAGKTRIILRCEFEQLAVGEIGFLASPDDPEPHGRTIFQDAALGKYGAVKDYIPPPPRVEDANTAPA